MMHDELVDEMNWAFDEMEKVMARFHERGMGLMADEYRARWVSLDDAFYAAAAKGECTDAIIAQMLELEEQVVEAEGMMSPYVLP